MNQTRTPTKDKKILLIQVDQHYDGCTSHGGFLNKSYFCFDYEKGFDHDVIPVKAENVLPVIEKIVPIMRATNHRNSAVINVIVTSLEQIVIDITKVIRQKQENHV